MLCNLTKRTTCTTAHAQPRRGIQQALAEKSPFMWRPCLLGIFIAFMQKYQFSVSPRIFYSLNFQENSNKLILLLNGNDIRKHSSETWGDRKEKRKVNAEEKS